MTKDPHCVFAMSFAKFSAGTGYKSIDLIAAYQDYYHTCLSLCNYIYKFCQIAGSRVPGG